MCCHKKVILVQQPHGIFVHRRIICILVHVYRELVVSQYGIYAEFILADYRFLVLKVLPDEFQDCPALAQVAQVGGFGLAAHLLFHGFIGHEQIVLLGRVQFSGHWVKCWTCHFL